MNDLVHQVEATTNATKAIEARMSNEVWDRQKLWEMKRDALVAVMQQLHLADDAILFLSNAFGTDAARKDPAEQEVARGEALNEWQNVSRQLDQSKIMALLVCSNTTNSAVFKATTHIRSTFSQIIRGKVGNYLELAPALQSALLEVQACIRSELGIVQDSNTGTH